MSHTPGYLMDKPVPPEIAEIQSSSVTFTWKPSRAATADDGELASHFAVEHHVEYQQVCPCVGLHMLSTVDMQLNFVFCSPAISASRDWGLLTRSWASPSNRATPRMERASSKRPLSNLTVVL